MTLIANLLLSLLLTGDPQDKRPLFHKDDAKGFTIMRPRGEEWDIKTSAPGFLQNTSVAVAHRIDDIGVQIHYYTPAPGGSTNWPPLKDIASQFLDNLKKDKDGKPIAGRTITVRKNDDARKAGVTVIGKTRIPVTQIRGTGSWYLDFVLEEQKQKIVVRMWTFLKSNNLIRLSIVGSDELFVKHWRKLYYVLATFRTFSPKRR